MRVEPLYSPRWGSLRLTPIIFMYYYFAADSVILPHCENVHVHTQIFRRITGAGLVIMISVADLSVLSGVSVLIY